MLKIARFPYNMTRQVPYHVWNNSESIYQLCPHRSILSIATVIHPLLILRSWYALQVILRLQRCSRLVVLRKINRPITTVAMKMDDIAVPTGVIPVSRSGLAYGTDPIRAWQSHERPIDTQFPVNPCS